MNLMFFRYTLLVLILTLISLQPYVFGRTLQSQSGARVSQQEAIKKVEQVMLSLLRDGDPNSLLLTLQQAAVDLSNSQKTLLRLNQLEEAALGSYYMGVVQELQATWRDAYDRYKQGYDLMRESKSPIQQNGIFVEHATFEEYGVRGYAVAGLHLSKNSRALIRTSWRDAKDFYSQACDLASRAHHKLYKAMALIGLAKVENWGLRDYGGAISHINEATELLADGGNKPQQYFALEIKAEIQQNLGQFNESRSISTKAIELASILNDQALLCFAMLNRATITYRQLNPSKGLSDCMKFGVQDCADAATQADQDYKQALEVANRLGFSSLVTSQKISQRLLQVRIEGLKKYEGRASSAEKSLAVSPMASPSDANRGIDLSPESQKKVASALEQIMGIKEGSFNQIVTAMDKINDPTLSDPALSYKWQADAMMYIHNKPDAALTQYRKAIEELESQRSNFRNVNDRISFQATRTSIYQEAFLLLAAQSKWGEAFDIAEKARSRALADLIQSKDRDVSSTDMFSQMSFSITPPWANGSIQARRQMENRGENRERATSVSIISQQVNLKELQQSMQKDKYEVIYYTALNFGMAIWHISANSTDMQVSYLWGRDLTNAITKIQSGLRNADGKFDETTAKWLYNIRVVAMS